MSPHTTRRSFTELLLLPIPIILIPIRGTTPGWGWRWVRRDLRSVLGPAATGAIAIGTTATSTSTTTTTLTETPTETSTVVKLARATGGSITRNTGEMLPTGTGKRRISTAPMPVSSLGAELALALAAVPELEHVPVEAELEPAQVEAELERVPVEVAPVLVPVVAQPELVPVELALGLVPVAAELQLAQVVVEPELVPVAVALRTRSVTAVHHHGLVPLRAA